MNNQLCDQSQKVGAGYQNIAQGAILGGEGVARSQRDTVGCKGALSFTFSEALKHIKNGQNMRRIGWNGHGMRVFLWKGEDASKLHERASHLNAIRADLFKQPEDRLYPQPPIRMMPHFRLVTPDGHVSTWVPSVTDLLAEDWIVA